MLTMMRVADHVPPSWPHGPQRQQLHLDVAVEALDSASASAVALGAIAADQQASPDNGA